MTFSQTAVAPGNVYRDAPVASPPLADEVSVRSLAGAAPRDGRNAVLCGLAVVVAVLLTWPVAELPYNDDWSYSFTVADLVRTGHLHYNGWASASLVAQAYWGALWVKVAGLFSAHLAADHYFTILRVSTVPLAAAAVSMCYLLARRCGLTARSAAFTALLLGTSPLYLPVAATFMTDAPGLFCIFLSIYAIVRGAESPKRSSAVGWAVVGTVVGFVGGTGRQVVWVAPGVALPYAAWVRRRDVAFVVVAAVAWLCVIVGAKLTLSWFARQPLALPEPNIKADLKWAAKQPVHTFFNVLSIGLTTVWLSLPVAWGVVRDFRGLVRTAIATGLLLTLAMILIVADRAKYAAVPWMTNTMDVHGVLDGVEISGRPEVWPKLACVAMAVVVFVVSAVMAADVLARLSRPLTAGRRAADFFLAPPPGRAAWPTLLLFAAAYTAVLFPRSARDLVFDRYVIPLLPVLSIALLLRFQRQGIPRAAAVASCVLLGGYALYAVASTQDVTALARARVAAAKRLTDAGVPRTALLAHFEYDSWTQLLVAGHVNDPRLPKGVYDPAVDEGTPAVRPEYRLEAKPAPDTQRTPFGVVPYFSLLPPFHRFVYVDRFLDPWWIDPVRAALHPHKRRSGLPTAATSDADGK